MSVHDFWHGDIDLLKAYQTAYIRDVSYRAWAISKEMVTSTLMALGLGFSTKKDENPIYPAWEDPIKKIEEKIVPMSSSEKNKKFATTMKNQTAFIHELLYGKKDE